MGWITGNLINKINKLSMNDLTTKHKRLGWFQSRFTDTDRGDKLIVILTVIGVVSLMVANLAYHYGFR